MNIQLLLLTLENFKCHEHLTIQFDGKNTDIYGENAVGKSSIYDGLTWLLFGKDSHGKKDFDIKPLTPSGDVKDHAAITSVEAVLRVDGANRTLKRTYYEVWSTKRGSTEATFEGHSGDYFVDDVPCKKSEFTRKVGELIDENIFRLLTSITYFASELPWQERRAALFAVADVATDAEILASDARFAPLVTAMQGIPMDDFRKKLIAQRKKLNKVRIDTPARLDECKKSVYDLSAIDFHALKRQKAETQERRSTLQKVLDQLEHDGGKIELQNQILCLQNALDRLENENLAFRLQQQSTDSQSEADTIRRRLDAINAQQNRRQWDLDYLRDREKKLLEQVAACRAQWDAINSEQFHGGICPTCGQTLPPDKLEASKSAFAQDKTRRKNDAVTAANRAKEQLQNIHDDMASLAREIAVDHQQTKELTDQLHLLENQPKIVIEDTPGYADKKAKLLSQVSALQAKLHDLEQQSTPRLQSLRETLASVDSELSRITGELAKKSALEYANIRMEELRAQAAAASEQLNHLDELLSLCDEFMRYKATFIEESINRRFSLVRFRLFREQINGGLEDCCDVTVDGVPYATGLNSGAKVNAGVDIINTLSRHYDAKVPLFIDNAESVTQLIPAETQVIRLIVSEDDKELRCVQK